MNTEITHYIKTESDWERRYSALQLENDLLKLKVSNYGKHYSALESQLLAQDNAILRKDKELTDVSMKLSMNKWCNFLAFIFGVFGGLLL